MGSGAPPNPLGPAVAPPKSHSQYHGSCCGTGQGIPGALELLGTPRMVFRGPPSLPGTDLAVMGQPEIAQAAPVPQAAPLREEMASLG